MKLPIDMPKQFNSLLILLLTFIIQNSHSNPRAQSASTSYSLVTYNVENLFDAEIRTVLRIIKSDILENWFDAVIVTMLI